MASQERNDSPEMKYSPEFGMTPVCIKSEPDDDDCGLILTVDEISPAGVKCEPEDWLEESKNSCEGAQPMCLISPCSDGQGSTAEHMSSVKLEEESSLNTFDDIEVTSNETKMEMKPTLCSYDGNSPELKPDVSSTLESRSQNSGCEMITVQERSPQWVKHEPCPTHIEHTTLCGNNFSLIDKLKHQVMNHEDEKSYSCTLCSKKFVWPSDLKIHLLTHTGEKPHSCSTCGKNFSQTSHLTRHTLSHTGVKPYSCSICDKTFSQSSHLKRHALMHTKEKPHSCEFCGKKFAQSGGLKYHMRNHTGESHPCDVCGKHFTQPLSLKCHMKSHKELKL